MKNFNYLIYFSLVFLLTSCAVGRKISYQNENTLLLYKPSKSIVVTFYDQRKEIVNGKENPSFSGHLNATLQIPYNINTQSGNTLAQDFAKSVSNAISKQTQQSIVITLAHADSITKALKALQNSEYDLLLLFTQRYNRQNGIKPKKDKPFKRHGIETFMGTASFGTMGAGGRNHLD